MSYAKGQVVRLRVWFTDPASNDARVQPTAVTIKVQTPGLVDSSYTPTFDSSDTSYYYDLTCSESGTYYYRGEGSGGYASAREKSFTVDSSQF